MFKTLFRHQKKYCMIKGINIESDIFGNNKYCYTDYLGAVKRGFLSPETGFERQGFLFQREAAFDAVKYLVNRIINVAKHTNDYSVAPSKMVAANAVGFWLDKIKKKQTLSELAFLIKVHIKDLYALMPPHNSKHYPKADKIMKHLSELSNYTASETLINHKNFEQKNAIGG